MTKQRGSDIINMKIGGHRVEMTRNDLVRNAMSMEVARTVMWLVESGIHVNELGRMVELDHQWRQIYLDASLKMRIIAPAQRGKTLYELVKTMAQAMHGLAVGWVMPKDAKVKELVHSKFDPTIKNTELYSELVGTRGTDTVHYKTVGQYGRIHLVTSNSHDELCSFTADCMHVDEYDLCNKVHLPMYPSRMNRSPFKFDDCISTPTLPGGERAPNLVVPDNIHTEFLCGDQHRYWNTCPHCGTSQILDWYDNVVECENDESGRIVKYNVMDKDWEPGDPQDLRVCCKSCKRPFDRLEQGEWRALHPGRMIRTYWVEALASEFGPTIADLLKEFGDALGNPTKMQHFHNLQLGRPYSGGMLRFTRDLIDRCVHADQMKHGCVQPTTMGVDVNRPWLDVQISAYVAGDRIKIHADKVQGGIDEIIGLVKRFNVRGLVIDNQPEVKFAMSLQEEVEAKTNCKVIRCKYSTAQMDKLYSISVAGENKKLDHPRLITADRTIAIDAVYECFQRREIRMFANWATIMDGAMLREMSTPVRRVVFNEQTGTDRFTWEGKPDHQLHAAVYDWLAGELFGMTLHRDFSQVLPVMTSIMHTSEAPDPGKAARDEIAKRTDDVVIFRG
jgi:hypothetical protein